MCDERLLTETTRGFFILRSHCFLSSWSLLIVCPTTLSHETPQKHTDKVDMPNPHSDNHLGRSHSGVGVEGWWGWKEKSRLLSLTAFFFPGWGQWLWWKSRSSRLFPGNHGRVTEEAPESWAPGGGTDHLWQMQCGLGAVGMREEATCLPARRWCL